ncbi:MAG: hypothetical protein IPG50_31155 [Myxococcales bacterium]|nr:hypothetical protein [Myxococcales bacterium]
MDTQMDSKAQDNKALPKVAYSITERGGRSYWTRIGRGFVNRDGSITVKLEAVPVSGTLQLRDPDPRDDVAGPAQFGGRAAVAPQELPF